MTQVPGASAGDSPPATPKLMTPSAPSRMALEREAAKSLPLPLQITRTPGPAAIRASNAKPTTAISRSPYPIPCAQFRPLSLPPRICDEAFLVPTRSTIRALHRIAAVDAFSGKVQSAFQNDKLNRRRFRSLTATGRQRLVREARRG